MHNNKILTILRIIEMQRTPRVCIWWKWPKRLMECERIRSGKYCTNLILVFSKCIYHFSKLDMHVSWLCNVQCYAHITPFIIHILVDSYHMTHSTWLWKWHCFVNYRLFFCTSFPCVQPNWPFSCGLLVNMQSGRRNRFLIWGFFVFLGVGCVLWILYSTLDTRGL